MCTIELFIQLKKYLLYHIKHLRPSSISIIQLEFDDLHLYLFLYLFMLLT